MNTPLAHIVEPQALLLVWQGADESDLQSRTRRVVGQITHEATGAARLRYLNDTPDFRAACEQGFMGYPGFTLNASEHSSKAVMDALMRRLPPRRREDFADYLAMHRLPAPFKLSDFALLGYTGALLPSDGFSVVPVFDEADTPGEYILEVAGVRHNCPDVSALAAGDAVQLRPEPDNPAEPGHTAISIWHGERKLGYVNRALAPMVARWLAHKTVHAHIERKNGKPERPLIYVRLRID